MKLAFHGSTSMKSELVTDVEVSARAGYKALEVWASKVDVYLASHCLADLAKVFVDNKVEPTAMNSLEFIGFRGHEYPKIKARCQQLCEIAQAIGCQTLVVVPGPTPMGQDSPAIGWDKVVHEYVKVLRDLGDIAQPYGVKLAFEFLGFGWCSVRTPRGARQIVEKADHQSVGMNFDCCHFYGGGGELDEINELDPSLLLTFHMNDMEDLPKEAMTDGHRLIPGLGVIQLGQICQRLKNIGYDGVCAIELFRPEYWQWDPYDLALKARQATIEVLSPYFDVE